MKSKVLYIFIGLILFAVDVRGQEPNLVFPDGLIVTFENKISETSAEKSGSRTKIVSMLSTYASTNVIHRILVDRGSKIFFGYNLEIRKEAEGGKFLLTFKPLSGMLIADSGELKVMPRFPAPLKISDGDTVSVELLENQKTGEKISDIIKVVQGKPNPNAKVNRMSPPNTNNSGTTISQISSVPIDDSKDEPKDFTLDQVKMQVINAKLSVNGKLLAENKSSINKTISFYLKGKGRFTLSPVPRENFDFKRIGLIDGNNISFEFNGDAYEIASEYPVMFQNGKWNLWIFHEPDYRPADGAEIEFIKKGVLVLPKTN